MADYQVTAAAVVVPVAGTEKYLYKGALIPAGVKAADRDRLKGLGLIKEVKVERTSTRTTQADAAEAKAKADAEAKAAAEKK